MTIFSVLVITATFLILMWIVMLELLSRAGGWKRVAQRYAAPSAPEGRKYCMQSCSFSWVGYNGCLTIIVSPAGIHLSLWPLFRFSHPALLIPWSALHVLKVKSGGWIKEVKLAIDEPPLAKLTLPYKVVEAAGGLMPAWQNDESVASEIEQQR
jgi:hypothetical protein